MKLKALVIVILMSSYNAFGDESCRWNTDWDCWRITNSSSIKHYSRSLEGAIEQPYIDYLNRLLDIDLDNLQSLESATSILGQHYIKSLDSYTWWFERDDANDYNSKAITIEIEGSCLSTIRYADLSFVEHHGVTNNLLISTFRFCKNE